MIRLKHSKIHVNYRNNNWFSILMVFAFKWFNRWFDVEDHPLQSIGTVAGGLLAPAYWVLTAIRLLP
jgi:hypothetical protein